MKALKLAVAGLTVLVGVLLWTVHRLQQQAVSQPQAVATTPAAEPAAAPAPAAPAVPSPAAVEEPAKPSPVRSAKRPVTQPRGQQKPAAPVTVAESRPPESPAPATPPVAPARTEPAAPAATTPPPAPPAPRRVTIPAGTRLVVRTQNTLSTERNFAGDTFTATLDEPLVIDGLVIAEKGSEVEGRIVRSEKAGRVEGVSDLAIELVRLHTSDGQRLAIATGLHEVHGERSRGKDAKKVGIASGVGAIIGAIAGGGKGAAIGAGVGAGAGGGAVLATRGEHAVIPSESRLVFQTRTPIEVTERR